MTGGNNINEAKTGITEVNKVHSNIIIIYETNPNTKVSKLLSTNY